MYRLGFALLPILGRQCLVRGPEKMSNNERSFDVVAGVGPMVLHLVLPIRAEVIEAQAVGLRIDDVKQAAFEHHELRRVNLALENRILHALAIIETGLGSAAQAGLANRGCGGNIVSDEDVHENDLKFDRIVVIGPRRRGRRRGRREGGGPAAWLADGGAGRWWFFRRGKDE